MLHLISIVKNFRCLSCLEKIPLRQVKCQFTTEVNTNVAKDVIIYRNDNSRFFRMMNFFSITQFVFWNYLASFFYTMKDVKVQAKEDASWWQKVNLGDSKYKNTLCFLSSLLGSGIAITGFLYGLRSVKMLVLRKGGNSVSFVTYGPFGKDVIFTTPLDKVSAKASRHSAKSSVPLKIKGRPFYFSVDTRGHFVHPTIFDSTVGLGRKL